MTPDERDLRESLRKAAETRDRLRAELRAAVVAERERVCELVRLLDPCTTYYTDTNGEEREEVDWARTAEKLQRLIREAT